MEGEDMKQRGISLWMIAFLTLIPLVAACDRQGPPKPLGTATNKHVEESPAKPPREAAKAITGTFKTPLNDAHQAEGAIQGAADVTKKQVELANQ